MASASMAGNEPQYQVTLASGAIATRPTSFPGDRGGKPEQPVTVMEDGAVISSVTMF